MNNRFLSCRPRLFGLTICDVIIGILGILYIVIYYLGILAYLVAFPIYVYHIITR